MFFNICFTSKFLKIKKKLKMNNLQNHQNIYQYIKININKVISKKTIKNSNILFK